MVSVRTFASGRDLGFPVVTNFALLLDQEESAGHDAGAELVSHSLDFTFINHKFHGIGANEVVDLSLLGFIEGPLFYLGELLFIQLFSTLFVR